MPEPPHDLVKVRLEKLSRLRARGIDPYPHRYQRTHNTQQAVSYFKSVEETQGDDARSDEVTVAGRLMALRSMGRATFGDLLDGSGRIQVLFRRNALPETYDTLDDLDLGDWLGVRGPLFRTRTGEVTVEVRELTLLCKSLRPLPEKWHGLTDVEIRFRQRYLDLISNEEARRIALMRSRTRQLDAAVHG